MTGCAANSVNPAFASADAFARSLRTDNEFTLIAEQTGGGGGIAGFVTYYVMWLTDMRHPNVRPRAAPLRVVCVRRARAPRLFMFD